MSRAPSFAELGVPRDLAAAVADLGITVPFAIQAGTLSETLAGRDLSGKAPTGSGKTLAFSIPLAARVGKGRPGRPRGLVLVPTRELAAQVAAVLAPLARVRGRRVATFYGGTNLRRDEDVLARGVDVAVATPGRLEDLIARGRVALGDVDVVVIDEADRMADMGFLPVVRRLLDATSSERQTLLFSATLDGDVDVLVRRYQRDPVRREVHAPAEAAGDVRHLFWSAARLDRRRVTGDIVRRVAPAIVFTRTKRGADRLAKQLGQDGIAVAAIHGDRTQSQRERALDRFSRGEVTALVATDVAARGIHVDDVGVVVHYDLPASDKDYVHRSGRTGRAGAEGVVVSLVPPDQVGDLRTLQRDLGVRHELQPSNPASLGDIMTGQPRPRPAAQPPAGKRHGRPAAGDVRQLGGGSRGRRPRPPSGPVTETADGRPRRRPTRRPVLATPARRDTGA